MTCIYKMTMDLNVLDHLGINLYSNIAAVLAEAVANAWDADAEIVDIKIVDDGIGMSVDDMNGKSLRVGYRRRYEYVEHGKVSTKTWRKSGRRAVSADFAQPAFDFYGVRPDNPRTADSATTVLDFLKTRSDQHAKVDFLAVTGIEDRQWSSLVNHLMENSEVE